MDRKLMMLIGESQVDVIPDYDLRKFQGRHPAKTGDTRAIKLRARASSGG